MTRGIGKSRGQGFKAVGEIGGYGHADLCGRGVDGSDQNNGRQESP